MYLICLWSECVYTASWFLAVRGINCSFIVLFVMLSGPMNMGFDEAPTVCQLFGNCPKYWMLLLMALLCSSVLCQGGRVHLIRLSKEVEFVSPISCPSGFVVIVMCHDDHQKMNGFLTGHGSWDFALHLCVVVLPHVCVATWRVLTSVV